MDNKLVVILAVLMAVASFVAGKGATNGENLVNAEEATISKRARLDADDGFTARLDDRAAKRYLTVTTRSVHAREEKETS
jgi:hypothetical protein